MIVGLRIWLKVVFGRFLYILETGMRETVTIRRKTDFTFTDQLSRATPEMKINIRSIMGSSYKIAVWRTTTVWEVKEALDLLYNLDCESLNLVFHNVEMEDDKAMMDYNIQEDDTIMLVPKIDTGFNLVR